MASSLERRPEARRRRPRPASKCSTSTPRALAAARSDSPRQLSSLNVFRTLLHQESVTKAVAGTLTTLLYTGNRLDVRLRELVIMRIGWTTGSCYEWTQHWRVARGLDIPEAHLLAVRDWTSARCFSALERAALAATDETLTDGCISQRTWSRLAKQLDADLLVELVIAIGNWSMFSQLLKSLDVQLEDGVEPWPPDGRAPRAPNGALPHQSQAALALKTTNAALMTADPPERRAELVLVDRRRQRDRQTPAGARRHAVVVGGRNRRSRGPRTLRTRRDDPATAAARIDTE